MKVCIVGDTSMPLDEGMKNTSYHIAKAIAAHCEVMVLNPCDAFGSNFWYPLIQFQPEIIHYVPGPSIRSFVLLTIAKKMTSAKSVMSLTHPKPRLPRKLISCLLKPDLLLSPSTKTARHFQTLGRKIECIPNGVDMERFHPVSVNQRGRLRYKYGLMPDLFVVLHVGNTRKIRKLDVLTSLQGNGCQVLVVGSTTISGDASVNERLRNSGCLVWQRYIRSIEEVYALADCYVFPTEDAAGAIEHPLSVLEAMACNLPVVTKKFGALPELFAAGDGLYFVASDAEIISRVQGLQLSRERAATRSKALHHSWTEIGRRIFSLYTDLQ